VLDAADINFFNTILYAVYDKGRLTFK